MIVFDLDGTLTDDSHRRPLIAGKSRDDASFDEFHKLCPDDAPVLPLIALFRTLLWSYKSVEIWTGRSDAFRKETHIWLDAHVGHFDWTKILYNMRKHGDNSPDIVLKAAWLREAREYRGQFVELVFEDRARCVAMWRKFGITCAQVAPGDF
jgi:hypothetical protein